MTFKVDTIYVKDNEQVAFDIRILVDSVEYKQRLTKEQCFKLFAENECENAEIIDGCVHGLNCCLLEVHRPSEERGIYSKSSYLFTALQFFKVPITKRFVYNALLSKIRKWKKSDEKTANHAFAVSGVRRIGKTTVLQQLYNFLPDSVYVDGSVFNSDMFDFINKIRNSNTKYILIDEICKISLEELQPLISFVKCGSDDIFFVFTGSVPSVVEEIASAILDCNVIDLQPILYIERLQWKFRTISFEESVKKSTNDMFMKWLKTSNLYCNREEALKYVKGIVSDTMVSYTKFGYNNVLDKFLSQNGTSLNSVSELFYYVIACQFIYIAESSGKYIDAPVFSIANDFTGIAKTCRKRVNAIKAKYSNNAIQAFCEVLEGSKLARRIDLYTEDNNVSLKRVVDDYYVPAYLFEFPQLFSYVLGEDVSGNLLDLWVEYCILMKASYYYYNVGKYRVGDASFEVDVVYNYSEFDFDNKGIIEVKNRPERNSKISGYFGIDIDNVSEFVLSCNDNAFREVNFSRSGVSSEKFRTFDKVCRMRNDIIVLLLELAYINNVYEHQDVSMTLSDLYKKYAGGV